MMSFSPTGAAPVNLLPPSDRAAPWPALGDFSALPSEGRPLDLQRTTAEAPVAADVALADWSALMSAVKSRLERLVAEPPIISQLSSESTVPPAQLAHVAQLAPHAQQAQLAQLAQLAHLADGVRQCVAALDQLQATLERELARRPRLELEVFDLQTGLSQARAELAGTRAGEQQARHQALHDGLTALPNRGHFRDRLDLALGHPLAKQSPLTVFFLDLDGFKQVNDQHGHAVGDDLLRIVATRLARSLRADDMVCRWGGDEFAGLLLGAIEPSSLAQMAGKLVNAVSAPMQIGALRLSIRPSIGLAMAPADGTTADVLLRHADAALVRAKRRGGGHAFHELAPATDPGLSRA
jgi:diguanylate cyclase (GGDEF)-like protein